MREHPLAGPLGTPWRPLPALRWPVVVFRVALGIYLLLAVALSLTRVPWYDEGVLADTAWRFATLGKLGNFCMSEHGWLVNMPKMKEYTYWQFPGFMVLCGLVFKATGLSVLAMRGVSIAAGALFILGWKRLLMALSGDRNFACLAAAFLAGEYSLLGAASDGRMDMLTASCGIWSLAALARYARSGSKWTLLASGVALAVSAVSHPMSSIYGLCWIVLAVLLFLAGWDIRKGLSFRRLLLLILPAVILLGIWAVYLTRDTEALRGQISALSYRTGARVSAQIPITLLRRFLGYSLDSSARKIRAAMVIASWGALVATALLSALRRSHFARILAILTCAAVLGLTILDNQLLPPYLVHVMPFLTVVLAMVLFYLASVNPPGMKISVAAVLLFTALGLSGSIARAAEDKWRRDYQPMIAVVAPALESGALVFGGCEIAFATGFSDRLVDDRFAGVVSGVSPDYFVDNPDYNAVDPASEAAMQRRTERLKSEYRQILANPTFQVYRRANGAHPGSN